MSANNTQHYFYAHCICYWIGSRRLNNINIHIRKLEALSKNLNKRVLFVINQRLDDMNKKVDMSKYTSDSIDIIITYSKNTGGTVKSLHDCFKHLENEKITYDYIGCWEDDSLFKYDDFIERASELLKQDYIFVGSLWSNAYDLKKDLKDKCGIKPIGKLAGNRIVPWLKHKHIYHNTPDDTKEKKLDEDLYRWCEDPYITTYDNLKKIEMKLQSCFTLAPESERYNHREHGINYGEVGFPTRLHINGFKFIGLSKKFFSNDLQQKPTR